MSVGGKALSVLLQNVCLNQWKKEYTNKVFLEGEGKSYTYGDAAEYISNIAAILKEKLIAHHEVVPIIIDNSPEFILALLAVMSSGHIPYPISHTTKTYELNGKLQGIDNVCFIVDSSGGEVIADTSFKFLTIDELLLDSKKIDNSPINIIPYDSKLICGTSGTTENQKKVVLQLDRIISNALAHAQSLGLTSEERIFSCLPFYHGFTLLTHIFSVIGLKATFIAGNSTYPPAISRIINDHNVTYTSFVPALLDVIVNNYTYDMFEILDKVSVGSAPTSFNQLLRYRSFFKKQKLFLTYGQTEAGPRITTLKVTDVKEEYFKTIGKIIEGTEVVINNPNENGEGELWVKSEWQMVGYYNDYDSSLKVWQEGWLKTGDLAKIDNEGFVSLCGRTKDLIISGGVNISPMEIESVINMIPWVAESMVLPMTDVKRGEVPQAFIVSTRESSEKEIINELKDKLHHLKIPKKISFVKNIPKNNVGKPDRKAMINIIHNGDLS